MLKKDGVFEELKNRIVRLDYEPGKTLNEAEIAEEFGISRTPIRQAFQRLELNKLIQIVPRYGAQVPQIDFLQMKSLFEVTRVLDPYATKLATINADEEMIQQLDEIVARLRSYHMEEDYRLAIIDDEQFHEIILAKCENSWLEEIVTQLHFHSERLWHYCNRYFDSPDIFYSTLRAVLDAIKAHDPDLAERCAREHIDVFVDRIRSTLL